jgi:hypothetical protein
MSAMKNIRVIKAPGLIFESDPGTVEYVRMLDRQQPEEDQRLIIMDLDDTHLFLRGDEKTQAWLQKRIDEFSSGADAPKVGT